MVWASQTNLLIIPIQAEHFFAVQRLKWHAYILIVAFLLIQKER